MRLFMKTFRVRSDFKTETMRFKRKIYEKLLPELNNLIITAKMIGYKVTLSIEGDDVRGAWIYTVFDDKVIYKLAILHVYKKAERVVAVINGEDYTHILDSVAEGDDWSFPIKKILNEL
jgi:hypothetical protein